MADEKVILLVEDNPADVKLTLRAFRKASVDAKFVVARDGVEALDYLLPSGELSGREPESVPSLVLLDLKLPRIDGLEVLRQMRASPRTRLIPVIILTSSVEDQDVIRSYNLGANSYIHKPVDFLKFIEAARQLGLYWLVLNVPPIRAEAGKK
ncbi:MAG: response regulator [Alphaproteobacteria bacterium]|uniref:Response regulator n=1 Tax=Candidatus Nitrobium versatile TaxID=2884831 RepID=A0A953SH07_9BACT|nr:response regulator [Candidatus Nitrobium versatile]